MTTTRRLAAIMFADIVGYTAMMQENETKAREARDRHRQVIESKAGNHSGEIIQYYGDGALLIFPSAKESVDAAKEIQQQLQQDPKVPLRIGLHLGEIVRDNEGIFGDGVNITSRIESMAIPGSVLLSDRVFQEVSNHQDIRAISLGKFKLKNVKMPIELYALEEKGIKVPQINELASGKGKSVSKSIAIMPFTNMVAPETADYFTDGVSEEIINGLSLVEGINVISGSTCKAILESQENPVSVGRRLNVSYFLEGTVRKAGSRVRVSVRLISTDDGYQLWADSYDRNIDDIFEVQDEIAHKVINRLKISFDIPSQQETVVEKATENIEAYTEHLKGLHHLKIGNPEETKKAITHFQKALSLDPGFAMAECGLSRCYSYLGSCGVLPAVSAYAKSLKRVMSAIEKKGNFAEGHLALANIKFYHFWDWNGARESIEKAMSLGLNSAEVYQSYGLYFAAVGHPSKGIPEMLKALELDPLSIPVMSMLGTLYLFDQQYEKAIRQFEEILELQPTFRGAYQYKGISLACMGRYEEAMKVFKIYHDEVNHPNKAVLGMIISHNQMGNHEMADELLKRLYQRLEEDYSATVEVDLAVAHAGIGDYDTAIDFLEKVYDNRLSIACMGMIWVMRCPLFMNLWSHPGYKKLLDRMHLSN